VNWYNFKLTFQAGGTMLVFNVLESTANRLQLELTRVFHVFGDHS